MENNNLHTNIKLLDSCSLEAQEEIIDEIMQDYFKEKKARVFLDHILVKSQSALEQLPPSKEQEVAIIRSLSPMPWLRAMAACFVCLIAAYGWYQYTTPSSVVATPQQLASTYLKNEKVIGLVVTQMGPQLDLSTRLEGQKYFQSKEYEKSIAQLSNIETKNANDLWLLAMAYLHQGQPNYSQSIAYLLALRTQKSEYRTQETYWYLALNYIKRNQLNQAKSELEQMQGWHEVEKKTLLESISQHR